MTFVTCWFMKSGDCLKTSKSRWCQSQAKPESKRKFVKKKAAAVLRMGKVYVT